MILFNSYSKLNSKVTNVIVTLTIQLPYNFYHIRPTALFCVPFVLRYPPHGKGAVQMDGYSGESGFSCKVIVDLQRVFACLDIGNEQGDGWNQVYVADVAKATDSFSSKVVMPMSAQSEWRLDHHVTYNMYMNRTRLIQRFINILNLYMLHVV